MEPLTIVVAAALLVAIVELVKRTVNAWASSPPEQDRYVPALTVVLGVVAGSLGIIEDVGWLGGLVAGLTATGTYGGVKTTARAATSSKPRHIEGR